MWSDASVIASPMLPFVDAPRLHQEWSKVASYQSTVGMAGETESVVSTGDVLDNREQFIC